MTSRKHQRRLVLAVFALDERRGPAERGGIVRAVDRHFELCRVDAPREFDLEVELRAGKIRRGRSDRGLGKDGRSLDARTMRDAVAKCLIMVVLRVRKFRRGALGRPLSQKAHARSLTIHTCVVNDRLHYSVNSDLAILKASAAFIQINRRARAVQSLSFLEPEDLGTFPAR